MRIQRRVVGVVAAERRHLQLFDFGFLEAFRFRAAVLKPDFHLCFGQSERTAEFGTFGDAQVLFISEFLLQGEQLLRCEGCARLPVRFVFAQITFQFWWIVII